MQMSTSEGKYANLERELGAVLKSAGYDDVKRLVIFHDAIASTYMLHKYDSVGTALNLDEKVTKELHELYASVIDPINHCLSEIKNVNSDLAMLRGLGRNADKQLENKRDALAKTFTELVSERFKEEGLDSRPNVKAAIIYPLLIAVLNTWRKTDNEFAGKLIDSIKKVETDEKLKGIISWIDIPLRSKPADRNP